MNEDLEQHLLGLINPVLAREGVELVDFKLGRHQRKISIDLLIDLPQGGIGMYTCGRVNRALSDRITGSGLIAEGYALTVSSPGVDWPLTTEKDFLRTVNRKIRIVLAEPWEGRAELAGRNQGVTEHRVLLDTPEGAAAIPLDKIKRGTQIIEWRSE